MKAIQVRYLGATDHLGGRMKAWTEGGNSLTLPFQYELSSDYLRVELVAQALMDELGWNMHCEISGIGVLPGGDWCVTLRGKS